MHEKRLLFVTLVPTLEDGSIQAEMILVSRFLFIWMHTRSVCFEILRHQLIFSWNSPLEFLEFSEKALYNWHFSTTR